MPYPLERLSFLASAIAGRPVDVLESTKGPTRTDGNTIYIDGDTDSGLARTQVLVHSALIGGGLSAEVIGALRSRRDGLRRYLVLEVARAAASQSPEGRVLREGIDDRPNGFVLPRDIRDAVRRAAGTERLPDPPRSWGVIDARLLRSMTGPKDQAASSSPIDSIESLEDELAEEDSEPIGPLMKLFTAPVGSSALSRLFESLSGMGHSSSSDGPDGSEATGKATRSRRPAARAGLPIASWLAGKGRAVDPPGVTRLSYPEWDHRAGSYRTDWCRVSEMSLRSQPSSPSRADNAPSNAVSRKPLLRALAPIGLSSSRVGGRQDGPELDLDAVIDAVTDPGANQDTIYAEWLPRKRELGILVLLDCSGSTRDRSRSGATIFDLQREATSLILEVTSGIGCRTAALAFHSLGRSSVRLIEVKSFDDTWGPHIGQRLQLLAPDAYTRIGAAIRHGTHLLTTKCGSPRKLLVVVTDGFPYDSDYTADYAQSDTAHALAEARSLGVGCVCLSVGSNEPDDALGRVFGSSTTAILADAGDLAPVARRLFSDALARADLRRRLNQPPKPA